MPLKNPEMMDDQGYVFQSNSHNEYVCHFGNICLRYGIDQQEVLNYATEHFSKDYPDTASVINSCYKHVERKAPGTSTRRVRPTANALLPR